MQSSAVICPGVYGKTYPVKNLGWVLRNWKNIQSLRWDDEDDIFASYDGYFVAILNDGTIYVTPYASYSVFMRWVNRPIFRGLPLILNKRGCSTFHKINVGDIPKRFFD